MRKRLGYLDDHLEEIITGIFFAIMCVFIFIQIVSRYLLKNPLLFTEEVSRFAYVWVAFVGSSLAFKNREHIQIDFFINLLAPGVKRVVVILTDLTVLTLLGYLFIWGVRYLEFTKMMLTPALEIPLIVVNLALPVGFALSVLRVIKVLYEDIKGIAKTREGDGASC
jgi:TRAP-type C4-dicarboxylate transport system permease small subunit